MGRGMLTQEIRQLAMELLGKDISTTELRLMPYVQSVMVNEQRLDPNRINTEERTILSDWRNRGWIDGGCTQLFVSKFFWDAISDIIYMRYVNNE